MSDYDTASVTEHIFARVQHGIRRGALFAPGGTVVVAVSGGADSLCLLYALHALAPALGLRLHVAHLDHALRAASAADAAFVAAQARELGLPYTIERRDVGELARARRLSPETAAREVRYDFLRSVALAEGARAIATGHTRDDQAETVLMHLARGSGLNGLTGMAPRRGDLVRPLLDVSHAEAVAYCAALGLAPREDESNVSPAYRRNRVRHEIVPRLEEVYPDASANIARAARLLACDLALVERLARRALDSAVTERSAARVTLAAARWNEADPELRPHMLRLLLSDLLGHAAGFGEREYTSILAACADGAPDSRRELPKGLALARVGDAITLEMRRPIPALRARETSTVPPGQCASPVPAPEAPAETPLPVPGRVDTAVGCLRAEIVAAPHIWRGVPPTVAYLDPTAAGSALMVRSWRSGDRVRPLGLGGTRKVQDIFVDRKVPREARGRIPIVAGPRGVAWVAGLVVSEEYRAESGREAVRLTWEEPGGLEG